MLLIKSFLTGISQYCLKLIYSCLNERDKVWECFRCLKMMIQTTLHVSLFTIFCIERESLKWLYLYMKLSQSLKLLKLLKLLLWSFFRLKILHEVLCNSQFKKYNWNSTNSYDRKIWVAFPSYIALPCFSKHWKLSFNCDWILETFGFICHD